MRVLASIHLFYPQHCCGSESMMLHIMKFLISKGHHCRIILHQYSGLPYVYEGIEVFPATGDLDAYRWAEVIFTHLDFTQYTQAMAMAAQKPLVHFIHNDIPYQSIISGIKAQYCVYNSTWIADSLKYRWPGITLHPPCDTKYYNVCEDPAANEAITLISLNERKGGYLFYKIAKAMPDRKFIGVIGSYDNPGPMKLSQAEIVVILNNLPNVEIIANSPDILSVYKRTRILLMPSDYESWGRTATEAMCNGIPVICTPTPGLLENCGDSGLYVGVPRENTDPGEPQVDTGLVEDWVEKIRLLDNTLLYEQKSLYCRKRAAELDPVRELNALEHFVMNTRF